MSRVDVICVGGANWDTIAVVDVVPGSDERTTSRQIVEAGGGPAATAAVTLARQGVSVGFCGVVGDDEVGRRVRDSLEAEGVDTRWLVVDPELRSARSLLFAETSTGARTIVAGLIRPPAAHEVPLGSSEWLHLDQVGYHPALEALTEHATAAKVSLDAGNPIDGLTLDRIDLFVPTISALRARYGDASAEQLVHAAREEGASTVVATDGSRGAYVLESGSVVHVPAVPTEVVSTIGAGDVFHGALVAGIVSGLSPHEATRRANAVAALSCAGLDGRSAIPDARTTDQFLAHAASA